MRDRIKTGKSGSSEQCVISTAEGDDIKDQVFASEVVWRTEDNFQCFEPVQRASTPGITPLKVVLVGLILDG